MSSIALVIYSLIIFVGLLLFSVYLRLSTRMCTSKVSMEGKVVIVSGANSGIGFCTARNLAKRGARVILACRNERRALAAREEIIKQTGNTDVVFRPLDLASFNSVRKFAASILDTERRLDVLVNNAGGFGFSEYTENGIVEAMQVNYFSHFLLTLLLLPLLKKSSPSRIINMSSIFHFLGSFDRKTINTRRYFENVLNYSNSKFCMLMFTLELARRLKGTGVVVNAMHPGVIYTDITSHANAHMITHLFFRCWCILYNRSPDEGAQTIEHLAVSEECAEVSGKYFVDCESRFVLWTVKDECVAKELWDYSQMMVDYKAK